MGFKGLWKSIRIPSKRRQEESDADDLAEDIHTRLMAAYPEVPEWWYLTVLLIAMAFGVAGIASWDTYTSPGVVFFGIAMALIFIIPIGLITAITGELPCPGARGVR